MACVTIGNTVSFEDVSFDISVDNISNKRHFIPKVRVPKQIMDQICKRFNLPEVKGLTYVVLYSVPDIVTDKECSSGCTATVWTKVWGKKLSLRGNFKFAVELLGEHSDLECYIAATCTQSVLYID